MILNDLWLYYGNLDLLYPLITTCSSNNLTQVLLDYSLERKDFFFEFEIQNFRNLFLQIGKMHCYSSSQKYRLKFWESSEISSYYEGLLSCPVYLSILK